MIIDQVVGSAQTLQRQNVSFFCREANNISIVNGDIAGAVIMCDLTEPNIYRRALWHLAELKKSYPNLPVVLCGNKIDCKNITNHMKFISDVVQYQISAKSNYNYEKPLQSLLRQITSDITWHFVPGPAVAPPEVMIADSKA